MTEPDPQRHRLAPPPSLPSSPPRPAVIRIVVEVLGAFALVTALAAGLYRVRALDSWFHAIVAALFLYLPAAILRREGLDRYGLTLEPIRQNALLVGALVLAIFPLFAVGFVGWERIACAIPQLKALAPGPCPALRPGVSWLAQMSAHFGLRLPNDALRLAAAEILVVALPEEFFFRGYMQGRLEQAFPPHRSLFGVKVGGALVVSSALFALCHLAVQGHAATLAVFFPGLVFGWMRAKTGSVAAGTLFHALCNLYIETLQRSIFG